MSTGRFQDAKVMITGATAGIGEATATAFVDAGAGEVIITGRREQRLETLAAKLSAKGVPVTPVVMDVTDRVALEAMAKDHPDRFDVDILVNNAGLAQGLDPMHEADPTDWEVMVDTNVMGLLYVTRLVVPFMVARGQGDVVNIGSVAGRWTYPGGGVYCATKHAVRAISEGLRHDLLGKNVRVINVEPGLVETEFSVVRFKGDTERAKKVYEDTRTLAPADIAETVVWSCARPAHVNIQEIVVYPTDQSGVTRVHRGGRL